MLRPDVCASSMAGIVLRIPTSLKFGAGREAPWLSISPRLHMTVTSGSTSRGRLRLLSRRLRCTDASASLRDHDVKIDEGAEKGGDGERNITYGRLLPCPAHSWPARVEHAVVQQSGNVVELISDAFTLPTLYVADLIDFGAVHWSLLCPQPPDTATTQEFELYSKSNLLQDIGRRPSLRGKTIKEAQKTTRISNQFEELEAWSYLRVHVHPKRFPRCYKVDWQQRIIAETDSYVVLDKPAGVSVGGTVDNLRETCAAYAAQALGLQVPLFVTHQIDTCTEGCVVLAKTKKFTSHFHKLLRERQVQKCYLALATASVPVGRYTHFMRPDKFSPRIMSKVQHDGWFPCVMEILSCEKVPWPSPEVCKEYEIKNLGWTTQDYAYECSLKLLTGRTHQIRTQFASLDAPLVGDSMYMPAARARLDSPVVDPFLSAPLAQKGTSWVGNIKDRRDNGPMEKWVDLHGPEPECALGLQASGIQWMDGELFSYKAGTPWWQTKVHPT